METRSPADSLARPSSPGAGDDVLSPWDDYPIHQSPAPVTSVAPAAPGWAERFYFNLLHPSGEIAAIVGGGCYPVRGMAECYLCRIDGDRQLNVRARQELPQPGGTVPAGPFAFRCDAPLQDWTVEVDVDDARFHGTFTGLTSPFLYSTYDVESDEPGGPFDLFRHFVAIGRWRLHEAGGLDAAVPFLGVRDRTWGVRSRRVRMHLWSVFQLGDCCLTLVHQERADGSVLFSEAGFVHADGRAERLRVSGHEMSYGSRDRQVRRGRLELDGAGGPLTLEFERVGAAIRLAGAGYDDAQGARGRATALERDEFDLSDPEVAARTGRGTMDAGAVARLSGAYGGEGIGVVETAIARDHARYGMQIG